MVQNTQVEAQSAVREVLAGYAGSREAAEGLRFRGPGGVLGSALPGGIVQTIDCALLGGSGSVTVDIPITGITSGTALTYTYNSCSFSGFTYNGSFTLTYTQYTSPTDLTYTARWNNFTFSGNGVSSGSYSGIQTCRIQGTAASCSYSDNQGRAWSSSTTYSSAGVVNGSYSANYGNGVVTVTYTNFGATGGTARITGANNTEMLITRTGANSFTVAITINGTTTTYTINTGG